MSDQSEQIREAMRWLQLPVPASGEHDAVEAVAAELARLAIDLRDAADWIRLEIEAWRESGSPSPDLCTIASAYLEAGDPDLGPRLATSYFSLHARLKERPLLDHDSTSALLSHARLIALLAVEENLSSAQVAKLIAARDHRVPVAWPEVKTILGELFTAPRLSHEEVEAAYRADQDLELQFFADADERECIAMVADVARRLGFPGDIGEPLVRLFFAAEKPHGPHLQMLHIQCMIAEFYDHALRSLYEFNPRGQTAKWLFAQYPSSITAARDPFVNNAKSVDELTRGWAISKRQNGAAIERQAHALVSIVEGLDSMGFAARRELASWLRRLLARRIRLAAGSEISLPENLSSAHARSLVEAVAAGETHTRGILEQRMVDAIAAIRYRAPDWVSRGLLDSVNATNLSSRKCGDCDFQNSAAAQVVAFEAHAGRLTDLYVQSHLWTLRGVLRQRAAEWEENFGNDLDWTVKVVFVAHAVEVNPLPAQTLDGIELEVEAMTYGEFVQSHDGDEAALRDAVDRYIRAPLAADRTPDAIRATFLDIIEA